MPIQLFTIGFTRKSAERFFNSLKSAGVKRVLDVRLHRTSQLAGFAKQSDLPFFLRELGGIDYAVIPELAPTPDMLARYREGRDWEEYAQAYLGLLEQRQVEAKLDPGLFDGGCLLCSEHEPDHCHRRLAAEYLARHWTGVTHRHLS